VSHPLSLLRFNAETGHSWLEELRMPLLPVLTPPMIKSCIATLMQGRLFERGIYADELFTAAHVASSARRSFLFKSV